MASLTITIPDNTLTRVKTALKRLLVTGEAVDLENPTNDEIKAKIKSLCIKHIKDKLKEQEIQITYESFSFTDINLT